MDNLQSLGTPLEEWSMVNLLLLGNSFLTFEFQKIFPMAPLRAAARRTKYEDKDVKIGAGKVVGRCVAAVVRWPQT